MSRPKYYFYVKFTDGTAELIKVSKKKGFQLLEEIEIKEPVKFAQLIKDTRY